MCESDNECMCVRMSVYGENECICERMSALVEMSACK